MVNFAGRPMVRRQEVWRSATEVWRQGGEQEGDGEQRSNNKLCWFFDCFLTVRLFSNGCIQIQAQRVCLCLSTGNTDSIYIYICEHPFIIYFNARDL